MVSMTVGRLAMDHREHRANVIDKFRVDKIALNRWFTAPT